METNLLFGVLSCCFVVATGFFFPRVVVALMLGYMIGGPWWWLFCPLACLAALIDVTSWHIINQSGE